jgi:plasmid maintenance system antidote protein VapI
MLELCVESLDLTPLWPPSELAKVLGVAQGTVSKITTDARSITVDHAKRASRYFMMAPEAFLDFR